MSIPPKVYTGQTAPISGALVIANPEDTLYEIKGTMNISAYQSGSVLLTIGYNDEHNNLPQVVVPVFQRNDGTNVTFPNSKNVFSYSYEINCNPSAPVVVNTNGVFGLTYDLTVKAVPLSEQ